MQTSAKGVAALEVEEGVVLKAYLCPAHRWTIGSGLTAASGVIKPKAGMTITREMNTELVTLALRNRYEPAVNTTMGGSVKQHEFDAGVSFHWNTGSIYKASWVKKWKARAPRQDIRRALMLWSKGGGRVLPGLSARRDREASMLLDAQYVGVPLRASDAFQTISLAKITLRLSPEELQDVRAGFRKLGYDPGPSAWGVDLLAVVHFQRDHDLTDDGIIGRATLSTLQRRLDAPKAAAKPAAAAVVPIAVNTDVATAYTDALGVPGAEWIALGLVGFWALSTAWSYRDVVAVKIARPAPRIAKLLRSF